ncbi:TolC family protein [Zobellia galactanivorans]|uniref:TolC family protein n=1 Tax=Zobellia galactanivorans (strain DSM 12802 / CCUG 47099 / CIP 106680 / NCIMB 13871 / Dsij) TaxID=63186 RepID=UPI001C06597F|nr:TolC family protein [Zobellia galactanivorans]MBU3028321.1 TolC family protein [Zobellia galactanivorans]MDO6808604.1 TolC family protein [Zobellia galactanivorans]
MMHKIVTSLIFLCLTFGLSAQEKRLSKEEAVRLALEHNFGIKMAKNLTKIADNNQGILNSGYLPSLTGTAGANYNDLNSSTEYPGQFDTSGGAREDLEIDHAESQTYNAGLNLNYTLFDGLGRLYNYKRLKEQYQLTELQARETVENTLLQLFSIYFEVARLTENENVLKQALEISLDRITRAEYAFEYGQNTKLDILNAQVDVTNDSINLLNTKQQLANTKRDLNVVLNQSLSEDFQVDTIVKFIPRLQLDELIAQARENNVSILQAERNLNINEYDIKVNRSGYLPQIGLTGSYGWNLNQSAPNSFLPGQVIPGSNRSSLTFGLGASLTWNLFDGGRTTTLLKNSKISYENQELLQEQVELEVDRDILNALASYENRLNIYEIQEQNVITNRNNFERSKEQFQLGRITSIEFRQAQINLLNAQTNKNLAKYDAKLAELQLLQLTGQLLNVEL